MPTFGLLPAGFGLGPLATLERVVGLGLISDRLARLTLLLLTLQLVCASSPILLFPNGVFTASPYAPTLEDRYIVKT